METETRSSTLALRIFYALFAFMGLLAVVSSPSIKSCLALVLALGALYALVDVGGKAARVIGITCGSILIIAGTLDVFFWLLNMINGYAESVVWPIISLVISIVGIATVRRLWNPGQSDPQDAT